MAGEQISPELKRFIQNTINSVEQLEVLLFMMSHPDQEWGVLEVGERVRLTPDAVAAKMAELHAAGLLSKREDSEPLYRYAPGSPALASEVAHSLDRAYKERRDTVLQLIYSRPLDNIKIFADAFRIKGSDE